MSTVQWNRQVKPLGKRVLNGEGGGLRKQAVEKAERALATRGILAEWIRPRLLGGQEVRLLQDIELPLGLSCRMRIVPGVQAPFLWSQASAGSESGGLFDKIVFDMLILDGVANLFPLEIAGYGPATLQLLKRREEESIEQDENDQNSMPCNSPSSDYVTGIFAYWHALEKSPYGLLFTHDGMACTTYLERLEDEVREVLEDRVRRAAAGGEDINRINVDLPVEFCVLRRSRGRPLAVGVRFASLTAREVLT